MKKMLTKIAAVLMSALMITGCAGQGAGTAGSSSDKISIVTTIFPE